MQGAEECRLRHTNSMPQGETIEGNTADDTLMVDQGVTSPLDPRGRFFYTSASKLEKHLETDGF